MILALFVIIGLEIEAGGLYWTLLSITAVLKLIRSILEVIEDGK